MGEAKRRAERRQEAREAGVEFEPTFAVEVPRYRSVVWNIDRAVYDRLVEQHAWFLKQGQGSPSLEEFAASMLRTTGDAFAAAREEEVKRQQEGAA